MFSLPTFKRIKSKSELQEFSKRYCKASGLPIPESFLYNPNNNVFGIYHANQLIGGFILGNSASFRTIELFASENKQEEVYQQLNNTQDYTEICCFYIDRNYRTKTSFNFFVWLAMTFALKRYGRKYFIFGTCSRSLARLYAKTPKSVPIHEDFINRKSTFIFKAKRHHSVTGMLEIIAYKFKRTLKLKRRMSKPVTA